MEETRDHIDLEQLERRRRRHAQRRMMLRVLTVWVAAVALYFLWEAWAYRGLYAMFAEWQFYRFGHYLPIVTYAILVLLFGGPVLLLARPRKARYRRGHGPTPGPDFVLGTAMQFRRLLIGFAGGLGVAALATLFWSLTLPAMRPPERTITVGAEDSRTPASGAARLAGQVLYTRTSEFTQDMLVAKRGVRFAPVVSGKGNDPAIRYFVELPPGSDIDALEQAETGPVPAGGILMRNALPGSIVRLYGYAGLSVGSPYYVLFTSARTMRWSYYVTAAQLALGALIVLAAAFYQHRRVRRIETLVAENAAPA